MVLQPLPLELIEPLPSFEPGDSTVDDPERRVQQHPDDLQAHGNLFSGGVVQRLFRGLPDPAAAC